MFRPNIRAFFITQPQHNSHFLLYNGRQRVADPIPGTEPRRERNPHMAMTPEHHAKRAEHHAGEARKHAAAAREAAKGHRAPRERKPEAKKEARKR